MYNHSSFVIFQFDIKVKIEFEEQYCWTTWLEDLVWMFVLFCYWIKIFFSINYFIEEETKICTWVWNFFLRGVFFYDWDKNFFTKANLHRKPLSSLNWTTSPFWRLLYDHLIVGWSSLNFGTIVSRLQPAAPHKLLLQISTYALLCIV